MTSRPLPRGVRYRLYDYLESGNSYKIRLLFHQLGIPFERVAVDIQRGETRTPEFLARNPNGRIPMLELEDGTCLAESNAIQYYLAQGTPFWPTERMAQAHALQWMFFEQYSHEPYIAVLRSWHHTGKLEENRGAVAEKERRGYQALEVMEAHLASHPGSPQGGSAERPFFVGESYTIADIALYAYTHVAHEGGFDLLPFAAVRAWLERVRSQPGHVAITAKVGVGESG